MINKIEFTAKNLTSNAGVLLLLNYTEEQRIFQDLNEMLFFESKSTLQFRGVVTMTHTKKATIRFNNHMVAKNCTTKLIKDAGNAFI